MRFELIQGTSSLKGTCYFEFCKDSDRKETCWNKGAFYLEDGVFDFFYEVFAKANTNYDYYNFCKFERQELEKLREGLLQFETTLNSFRGRESDEAFFNKLTLHIESREGARSGWMERVEDLGKIAKQLRSLVDECLEGKEALWVLGM